MKWYISRGEYIFYVFLWIPTTYDEFWFSLQCWCVPVIDWSSFFLFYYLSEWVDQRHDTYTVRRWVVASSWEVGSTLDDMSLVQDDPIMSSPDDDIEWLQDFCDLFGSLSLDIDPSSIGDELARIAWSISVGRPEQESRAVKSWHRPLRLSEFIYSTIRRIKIEHSTDSGWRITTPNIWCSELLPHPTLYRISWWELDLSLCYSCFWLDHSYHTSIDIVTIRLAIIGILSGRDIEECDTRVWEYPMYTHSSIGQCYILQWIDLSPVIEDERSTSSRSVIPLEIRQVEKWSQSPRSCIELECPSREWAIESIHIARELIYSDSMLWCTIGRFHRESKK